MRVPSWLARVFPREKKCNRALILLNTPLDKRLVEETWGFAMLRICADGAANRLHDIHPTFVPDCVVGDFDSVTPDTLLHFQALGSEILNQAEDQDTTDLDKALAVAAARGCKEAVVVGEYSGSEGRLDHTFGIINSLFTTQTPRGSFEQIVVLSPQSTLQLLLPSDRGIGGGGGVGGAALEALQPATAMTDGAPSGIDAGKEGGGASTCSLPLGPPSSSRTSTPSPISSSSSSSSQPTQTRGEFVLEALPGATCGLVPIAGAAARFQVRVCSDGPLIWTMAFPNGPWEEQQGPANGVV
eukprot:CAMPEP_0171896042 /NCGR_PEP_ID=MMETSP0992-20121227/47366_1 /TAXON_ID=483369 /ORGANISM="non described non described, Strain CCMP2098" /LENGTH=298 /DNA_ID=CAMNT_0012524027 /DNA_START=208 /DNA_END=1104 /DNA_ORIENTATION=-